MRLYEYEAKDIFKKENIPIPNGKIAETGEQAYHIAEEMGGKNIVIKAQVLTGGRGKAGGIKIAENSERAKIITDEILKMKIKGFPVKCVLIEEALDIEKEIYLGVTIDRINYKIVLIGSQEGGVEIEEIAQTNPEKIHRLSFDIDEHFYPYQGIQFAKRMGFTGKEVPIIGKIVESLVNVFFQYEAKLVEINPLAILKDGNIVSADARMSVDEDALFRHKNLEEMDLIDRHEEGEMTERERWARDEGIPYLDLDGDIGMFPGGAGFGIAGIDLIIDLGGRPANFMDSGGGPTPERLAKMLMLLQENPNVKAIFAARFGGVSRCDDFARGVIQFLKTGKLTKPIAMRMTGNAVEEGVKIFDSAKKENPDMFKNIEIYGIETPIEYVAKRAVEMSLIYH